MGPPTEFWDMSLDEAIQAGLKNSKILRDLGGRVVAFPTSATTVYDPSITLSNPRFGEQAALSAFDAQWQQSFSFAKNDRAFNNSTLAGGATEVTQDLSQLQSQLSKTTAAGTQFALTNFWQHDHTDAPGNLFTHAWDTRWEASVRQPLLRGAGIDVNRIAGPRGINDFTISRGIVLARLDTDISTTQFEQGVRDYVRDVESAYWQLYFAYRQLDITRRGRDIARDTWLAVKAKYDNDLKGGEADQEAQSREQLFLFEQLVNQSLQGSTDGRSQIGVYNGERQLRRMIGMPVSDGPLIRPSDQPPTAKVIFDWSDCLGQAMTRRPELRIQRIRIRQRELELVAARNFLLPRLDALATYRLNGFGDDISSAGPRFSSALSDLGSFDHEEWQFGLQLEVPIGYRQEMAAAQHAQLNLVRERALLREQELQISHALADTVAGLESGYQTLLLSYNRMEAAQQVLAAREATFQADRVPIFTLLDSQRRLADAASQYVRALVDQALAIRDVHLQKGTLLAYNGVHLSEGPWLADASREVSQQFYRNREDILDYRFFHPKHLSRGVFPQGMPSPSGHIVTESDAGTAEKSSSDDKPLALPPVDDADDLERIPVPESLSP